MTSIVRYLVPVLASAAVLFASVSSAAPYPTQAVRIVVPFNSGGGTDTAARILAERLTSVLGQTVLVENRPGGNSVIATQAVARAPADGHWLLLTTDIHAINAAYGRALPYESMKDFSFVAQLTTSPLMLVAHPSLGIRSIAELVAAAKARPGELAFASLGTSSPHYLGFEWFKRMAGIDVLDVPYKGGGQALADNLAGQISLSLIVAGNGIRHAQAGKLAAIAVTSPKRAPVAPDVPTIAESGYPEFEIVNWYAILAPAKTPREIVERLNREIRTVLQQPEVVAKFVAAGLEPTTGSPEELEQLVQRDTDKYRRIIRLIDAPSAPR